MRLIWISKGAFCSYLIAFVCEEGHISVSERIHIFVSACIISLFAAICAVLHGRGFSQIFYAVVGRVAVDMIHILRHVSMLHQEDEAIGQVHLTASPTDHGSLSAVRSNGPYPLPRLTPLRGVVAGQVPIAVIGILLAADI